MQCNDNGYNGLQYSSKVLCWSALQLTVYLIINSIDSYNDYYIHRIALGPAFINTSREFARLETWNKQYILEYT